MMITMEQAFWKTVYTVMDWTARMKGLESLWVVETTPVGELRLRVTFHPDSLEASNMRRAFDMLREAAYEGDVERVVMISKRLADQW